MADTQAGIDPARNGRDHWDKTAAAFRSGAQTYRKMGSPLYAALCEGGASDPDIVALACQAQQGSQPVFHVLASVHYLLLRDPGHRLGQYFATITDDPLPPEQAFPDFARFCNSYRGEILELMASRTIQTTYVERCTSLMPALSMVADEAGEPLNLVEIGCSAGVLLAFDKYAYDIAGRGRIGPPDAPLTLAAEVQGGPELRIPRIGERIGLDLRTIDVQSGEERRWLMALTFPEFRDQRARLATALDIVAGTPMRKLQGDALDTLNFVLAETPSPLCIFHSACLYYWTAEAKDALDVLLRQASHGRDIYRVGIEGSERFNAYHKGQGLAPEQQQSAARASGDVIIARYRDGSQHSRIAATTTFSGPFVWAD